MESIHTKPHCKLFWEDKCERIYCLLAKKYFIDKKWNFKGAKEALNYMVNNAISDKELLIALDNIKIFECVFDCINWDDGADLTKKLF